MFGLKRPVFYDQAGEDEAGNVDPVGGFRAAYQPQELRQVRLSIGSPFKLASPRYLILWSPIYYNI